MTFSLPARAKINRHLDVGPRRKDGYHTLRTLFQEIDLCDTLTFSPEEFGIKLTLSTVGLPANDENLVVKALAALQKELKVKNGIRVHLDKQIPIGAGLGGGSSDAAAALWGGWILWKGLSPKKYRKGKIPPLLMKLARGLGADVPFFLKGGRAWARGIGDKLTFAGRSARQSVVLVYPNVHVSTPLAYQELDKSRKEGTKPKKPKGMFNSFEPVIMARFPEIQKVKDQLLALGAKPVMMSGSGSSVFGLVSSSAKGQKIIKELQERTRWKLFLTHFW